MTVVGDVDGDGEALEAGTVEAVGDATRVEVEIVVSGVEIGVVVEVRRTGSFGEGTRGAGTRVRAEEDFGEVGVVAFWTVLEPGVDGGMTGDGREGVGGVTTGEGEGEDFVVDVETKGAGDSFSGGSESYVDMM